MFAKYARIIILYILQGCALTVIVAVAGHPTSELNLQKDRFVLPA